MALILSGSGTIATSANTAIAIDTSGRVNNVYRPYFQVKGLNNITVFAAGQVVIWPTVVHNVGGYYSTSTGKFTAPIAGLYLFGWTSIGNNTNDTYRWRFQVNGLSVGDIHLRQDTTGTGSEYPTNGMYTLPWILNAGDTVNIFLSSDSGTAPYANNDSANDYPRFWGYLVG